VKKTLKILGITLAALAGLLIAAFVTLSIVFDPNQYKGEIIHLVKEKTGRDLRIDKKIGWSFFPKLGIEAGGLELGNAPGFGKDPFAQIDAAGVRVALLPLFGSRIAIDSVYLHGLTLNLARNTAGQTNWQDLAGSAKEPKAAKPQPEKEKKSGGQLPLESLSVGRLEIKKTNLLWRDAQAGSTLALRNLELTTGKFAAGEPMDLRLGFELARDKTAPVKIALTSRLTVSADALKLANVDLALDDSRLKGSIDVHNFASPALRFDLTLDKIDLDRYLAGDKPADKSTGKPAAGKAPAAEQPVELPLSTLRSLDVNGKFRIQDLKAFDLRSKEVQIQLVAKGGLITLGPNTAKLYSGSYRGETVVDVRGKQPQFRMDEKLEQVQIGPLLKDMQLFDHYSGAGNIALKLTAQGFDAAQIKRSLNGNASVAIKDGRIDGVDLGKFVKALSGREQALDKLTRLVPQPGDHTIFGQLTATFQIANGIATNRDLSLRTVDLVATGKGTANLVSEKLDYRLDLANIKDVGQKCKTFPIRITGAFANLEYLPDMETILGCQAQKALQKNMQKNFDQLLQPKKKSRLR
jgi:AsmA protein